MTDIFDSSDIQSVNPGNAPAPPPAGAFSDDMIASVGQASAAVQKPEITNTPPTDTVDTSGWWKSHPLVETPVALAEVAAHWATGGIGQIVGGWHQIIHGGSQESTEQAKQFENQITYEPKSDLGKAYAALPVSIARGAENMLNQGAQNVGLEHPIGTWITQPGQSLSEKVYEETGSPLLASVGAAAPTAITALFGAQKPLASVGTGVPAALADKFGIRKPLGVGVPADLFTARETGAAESVGISGNIAKLPAPVGKSGTTISSAIPAGSVGAARFNPNPYPALSAEETARGPYPIIKSSKVSTDAPEAEQTMRANIATQILGEPQRVRSGVITGNIDTLRSEYEQARAANPTPAGELLKAKIADEQNSLAAFGQQQVNATGASPNLLNDYQRGDLLNSVMWGPDGIKGLIDSQKKGLYDTAMQQAGQAPVQTANLDALRNNPQFAAEMKLRGQKEFLSGMSDLIDQAKTQGFEGAPAGSIAALEKLRQSLNRQWSPENRYFLGQAVDSIDQDVAAAGGPGLLEQARGTHRAEQIMLKSPGIKTLFGDVDPNGIQNGTPFEKIPQKLNNMPFDQWRHIYDTFDSVSGGTIPGTQLTVPNDLRLAAQQAKNEMSGSLVREVHAAGSSSSGLWSANAANKVLNARAQKLSLALDPEQQAAMHTLNYGGQIMPGAFSYEGAAQQTRRMSQEGLLSRNAVQIGASIGGTIPIPGAAWVGAKIGEKLRGGIQLKRLMNEAHQLDAQMEANAKLGNKP